MNSNELTRREKNTVVGIGILTLYTYLYTNTLNLWRTTVNDDMTLMIMFYSYTRII
jgi:hypothetical protein